MDKTILCCLILIGTYSFSLAKEADAMLFYRTIMEVKNQFNTKDQLIEADRLDFHYSSRSNSETNAVLAFKRIQKECGLQISNDINFESQFMSKRKQTRNSLSKLWRGVNRKSPCHITRLVDETDRLSRGSFRVSGYRDAIILEPLWIPALFGRLNANKGSWSVAANEGATILDLENIDSSLAGETIKRMPTAKSFKRGVPIGQLAVQMVNAYHLWLRNENLWISSGAGTNRLTAALLYHAGKINISKQLYESLEKQKSLEPSSYYRLARIYEEEGDESKAYNLVMEGLGRHKKKNSILLVLAAEYFLKRGKINRSEDLLRQCLNASPEYPPANILLAELEAKRGNRYETIKSCADTAAYCYGWPNEYLKRIDIVIISMIE